MYPRDILLYVLWAKRKDAYCSSVCGWGGRPSLGGGMGTSGEDALWNTLPGSEGTEEMNRTLKTVCVRKWETRRAARYLRTSHSACIWNSTGLTITLGWMPGGERERKWEMKTEKINACVHAWMHEGVRWGCAGTRDKGQYNPRTVITATRRFWERNENS